MLEVGLRYLSRRKAAIYLPISQGGTCTASPSNANAGSVRRMTRCRQREAVETYVDHPEGDTDRTKGHPG